jgi:hypothetical protein
VFLVQLAFEALGYVVDIADPSLYQDLAGLQ